MCAFRRLRIPSPARLSDPAFGGRWPRRILRWLILASVLLFASNLPAQDPQGVDEDALFPTTLAVASEMFESSERPQLPMPAQFLGADGELAICGEVIFGLGDGAGAWEKVGTLKREVPPDASTSDARGLVLFGGEEVTRVEWIDGRLRQTRYPDLPRPQERASGAWFGGQLYVAGDGFWTLDSEAVTPTWVERPAWPGPPRRGAALVAAMDELYLLGGTGEGAQEAFVYSPTAGWRARGALEGWPENAVVLPMGQSHALAVGGSAGAEMLAYNVITGTVRSLGRLPGGGGDAVAAAVGGGGIVVASGPRVFALRAVPVKTGFNWIDHSVVGAYLLAMVGMGIFFSRRSATAADFFRGGNRIPWWASGMSLFATGASAISLMAMPGKAFSGDWTYFTLSLYTVIVLPISIFFLAPLVRRLKIVTANEYLEKRFGLVARTFASVIFIFTQIAGRMASVMLLPAIALSAITGLSVITCILIMGVITTIYTFFGGLEAVVWTDTVQGFIMAASIGGCLILVLTKLGMGPVEMWETANAVGKFHMFDFSWDITEPTVLVFFVATLFTTLAAVGDQNFVQRVQCTPDMRQTRLAVGMQLVVAVPINLLLFGLGTALFLFYRNHPAALDPLVKADGIYPFFVAQQLPPGVSGLVVAALFAATMSTISSAICSVADLGVQDFYRRFNRNATDRKALVLGRVLTALVGTLGIIAAILLSRSTMTSVWDLAILVIGLISSGIVGLYFLGLLTRRANEAGAVTGVVIGLVAIAAVRAFTDVSVWFYVPLGSTVTFVVGYAASLVLPGRARDLAGLTIYTLPTGLFTSRDD